MRVTLETGKNRALDLIGKQDAHDIPVDAPADEPIFLEWVAARVHIFGIVSVRLILLQNDFAVLDA